MDDITTRAIVIGVNVFVTLAIVSLVIVMFFQMQEIYGVVASTDNSIYNKFDDFYSMYNGKVETGIGLLNTIKKYEDSNDKQVVITYPNSNKIRDEITNKNLNLSEENKIREATFLKDLMKENKTYNGTEYKYEDKYNVTVSSEDNNIVTINFQKIN